MENSIGISDEVTELLKTKHFISAEEVILMPQESHNFKAIGCRKLYPYKNHRKNPIKIFKGDEVEY